MNLNLICCRDLCIFVCRLSGPSCCVFCLMPVEDRVIETAELVLGLRQLSVIPGKGGGLESWGFWTVCTPITTLCENEGLSHHTSEWLCHNFNHKRKGADICDFRGVFTTYLHTHDTVCVIDQPTFLLVLGGFACELPIKTAAIMYTLHIHRQKNVQKRKSKLNINCKL